LVVRGLRWGHKTTTFARPSPGGIPRLRDITRSAAGGGAAHGQLAAAGSEQAAPARSRGSVAAPVDPLSMLLLGPLRAVGVLLEVAEVRVPSDLSALVASGIKQAPRVSVAGPSRPFPDKSGPAAEPYGSQPATRATECPQVARLGVGRRGSPHRGSSSLFPESVASPVGCSGDNEEWVPTDVDSAAPPLEDYTRRGHSLTAGVSGWHSGAA
jgi:hypothetical protein